MPSYESRCEVRWADLDPNGHVRHTVFMDWATQCRVAVLASAGLTPRRFQELGMGPVLFREEADYLREVDAGDQITVALELVGASADWKHFACTARRCWCGARGSTSGPARSARRRPRSPRRSRASPGRPTSPRSCGRRAEPGPGIYGPRRSRCPTLAFPGQSAPFLKGVR
jgi:hypothetical protein